MAGISTDKPDLTVELGALTPAEPCGVCVTFSPWNRELTVRPVDGPSEAALARAAACEVCVAHYGADGIAVRLWPILCDWVPSLVFEDCQCETCTGQIEFRISAGTDFYEP